MAIMRSLLVGGALLVTSGCGEQAGFNAGGSSTVSHRDAAGADAGAPGDANSTVANGSEGGASAGAGGNGAGSVAAGTDASGAAAGGVDAQTDQGATTVNVGVDAGTGANAGNGSQTDSSQGQQGSGADSSSGSGSISLNEGPSVVYMPPGSTSEGVVGGHFDADTSSRAYAWSKGTTDAHVHEYDDTYGSTGIDALSFPASSKLNAIQSVITDPAKRFVLMVVNADLSPGGVIEVNGDKYWVKTAQAAMRSNHQVYTLGAPAQAGDKQLTNLKLFFDKDAFTKGLVIPTATGCVRANDMGKNGEYRNGALLIQAIDADKYELDAKTGAATVASGSLLWEVSLFWHRDGDCYK